MASRAPMTAGQCSAIKSFGNGHLLFSGSTHWGSLTHPGDVCLTEPPPTPDFGPAALGAREQTRDDGDGVTLGPDTLSCRCLCSPGSMT